MIGKSLLVLLAIVALTHAGVVVLDDSNYTAFVEEHPYVFVKFYAPWCGHCKAMAADYEKLGQAAEGKEYVIAEVDATLSPNVSQELGVEGYPTLKFIVNGYALNFDGERKLQGMKSWIESTMEAEISKISEDELKELIGNTNFVLIQGATSEQLKSLRFIKSLVDTDFYAVEGGDFKITLHLKGSKTFEYSGEVNLQELADWTITNTMGSLVALTGDQVLRRVFENKNQLPCFLLLKGKDWTDSLFSTLQEVCQENNNKFLCAYADETHEIFQGISRFLKAESSDNSYLVFFDFGIKNGWMMANPTQLTKDSLSQFHEDVLAGKIEKFHSDDKKEEAPQEVKYENVPLLTAETYNDTIKNNQKVFIEYYAPGCQHCVAFAPEYEKLATQLKEQNSDIVIAAVNVMEQEDIGSWANVNGYPTLRFYYNGVEIDYNEDRKAQKIVDFIDKVTKFQMRTKNTKADLERPVVALYGISEEDPLIYLPFRFTRYPIYRVLEGEEFKVEVLDKKFASYSGDRNLNAVANWLQETTEETIVNIVSEYPSRKLNKALENHTPLLVIINRDNSDTFKAAFTFLEAFCEDKLEFICGTANKDDKEYESFNEWINDPENEKNRLLYLDSKEFKKYLFEGDLAALSEDAVNQFVADVQAGKIEAHKSAGEGEAPEGEEEPEVQVIEEGEEVPQEAEAEATPQETPEEL